MKSFNALHVQTFQSKNNIVILVKTIVIYQSSIDQTTTSLIILNCSNQ